jgi:poly(3-hydroxybutyrate) depolymerase
MCREEKDTKMFSWALQHFMRSLAFLLVGLYSPTLARLIGTSPKAYEGDTSGCGKSQDDIGKSFLRSVSSGEIERNYTVHLPSNYSSEHHHPAILGFHGSESVGAFFEADTRFSDVADGYIMVYPNGLGGAWAGATYSNASVPEDLQFVWDLLADLRQEFCVDSARIFATGMSIGGGFVDTIACNATVGQEFAAFAPVAGAYYTDNDDKYKYCKPAAPLPMFSIHGARDESVPYDGGQGSGGELPSIPDWYSPT